MPQPHCDSLHTFDNKITGINALATRTHRAINDVSSARASRSLQSSFSHSLGPLWVTLSLFSCEVMREKSSSADVCISPIVASALSSRPFVPSSGTRTHTRHSCAGQSLHRPQHTAHVHTHTPSEGLSRVAASLLDSSVSDSPICFIVSSIPRTSSYHTPAYQ